MAIIDALESLALSVLSQLVASVIPTPSSLPPSVQPPSSILPTPPSSKDAATSSQSGPQPSLVKKPKKLKQATTLWKSPGIVVILAKRSGQLFGILLFAPLLQFPC